MRAVGRRGSKPHIYSAILPPLPRRKYGHLISKFGMNTPKEKCALCRRLKKDCPAHTERKG